jgi:hypothetical protein
MTLTDTVPVLRPSVRGTEELAAIGRSVTGRECLKTVPRAGTAVLRGEWVIGLVVDAVPERSFCVFIERRVHRMTGLPGRAIMAGWTWTGLCGTGT